MNMFVMERPKGTLGENNAHKTLSMGNVSLNVGPVQLAVMLLWLKVCQQFDLLVGSCFPRAYVIAFNVTPLK